MIQLKKILLPTDFSEPAEKAILYACELAERFGSELHLLHVVHDLTTDIPDFGMGVAFPGYVDQLPLQQEQLKEAAQQHLRQVLPADYRPHVETQFATRQGPAFLEIIGYARDYDIDLIVLGTHGRTGLSHALLGSVAEKVVRKAPCPVLTIRPDQHDFVMP